MSYIDPEAKREYQRRWLADRRAEYIAKCGGCCKSCGSSVFLEFHHLDPAAKESHRIWSWRRERIEAEVAKCILLCRECHKEETAKYARQQLVAA